MSRLNADCLGEILEYLIDLDDKPTLRSCLFVNHLWCKVAVRILWSDTDNYETVNIITLIACLPEESKEILHNNGIIISAPTSKPPTFNYASFCKVLSINDVSFMVKNLLLKQSIISRYELDNDIRIVNIVEQEIFKLFMNKISTLHVLRLLENNANLTLAYPGANDCLRNLSVLECDSNINSEFFHQLSQICQSLLLLTIDFHEDIVSNGLEDLILAQKALEYFHIECHTDLPEIRSLTKLPNTITTLIACGNYWTMPLSFINRLTNLRELKLAFELSPYEESDRLQSNFNELQNTYFSQLKHLRIYIGSRKELSLTKFIEINGNNLEELQINGVSDVNSLNLTISKFCLNLKKLSIGFDNNELEIFKIVLNKCQYLESIDILCGYEYLSEKNALEMLAKYSPKNVCEINFVYEGYLQATELSSEELESFFINWSNRSPQKSLSLTVSGLFFKHSAKDSAIIEHMNIIDKYSKLGIIKKFCER